MNCSHYMVSKYIQFLKYKNIIFKVIFKINVEITIQNIIITFYSIIEIQLFYYIIL